MTLTQESVKKLKRRIVDRIHKTFSLRLLLEIAAILEVRTDDIIE